MCPSIQHPHSNHLYPQHHQNHHLLDGHHCLHYVGMHCGCHHHRHDYRQAHHVHRCLAYASADTSHGCCCSHPRSHSLPHQHAHLLHLRSHRGHHLNLHL